MNKLPSTKTMYRALLNRDTEFEGVFYVAVKTTKIFCRPTCTAKTPKPENVEYFSSSQDAINAGYRACLRCRPLEKSKKLPENVNTLLKAVEESPTRKLLDSELYKFGVDPSTARRLFKKHFGLTFQAYHRARRMGLALNEVRKGEDIISAQLNNGFESASGFWEAFKKVFGSPASNANRLDCLKTKWIETPLGTMIALANEDGLHLLEFLDRKGLEKEISVLRKKTGYAIVPGNNAYLEQISKELKDYFEGRSVCFTVPLLVRGTDFEENVWKTLQTILPGETWSYTELAEKIGRTGAVRAVGRANGKNSLAIVIPCHRVVRADGSLCGYGGGLWRKRWLIDHEKKIMGK
jgi:AraC family transcriptional regulator of adaptative response/methylated-DNA-[protein]-cysteine methyltransferase